MGGLFRQQLVVVLVFWLTVAAPMTCEYHGLLLFSAPGPSVVAHLEHTNHQYSLRTSDHHLHNHEMATSVTLMQSLFLMALPIDLQIQSPEESRSFDLPGLTSFLEWILPPPDQPPRSSGLIRALQP